MTASPPGPPSPPGRWKRWGRRLGKLVLLCVAARLLLALLLPWIVDWSAAALGMSAQYRSASLSLLGLSLRFEDLVLRDAADPQGTPLLAAHEIVIDVATQRLLHGELVVIDAAVAGARILVRRGEDGQLRLPAAFRGGEATESPPEQASAWPERFDLPVEIRSARLHDVRIHYEDDSRSPPQRSEVAIDLEATNVGLAGVPGAIEVRLYSPTWIDELWLKAATTTEADRLRIEWEGRVRGALPPEVRGALAEPGRGSLPFGVDLRGDVQCDATGPSPRVPSLGATVHVAASLGGRPALAVELAAGPARATAEGWDVPIGASVQAEDLVDDLRLADGKLVLTHDGPTLTTGLSCRGLSLRLLQPLLEFRGVYWPAAGIDATASLHATALSTADGPSLSVRLQDLLVGTADDQINMPRLALEGLRTANGSTSIDALEVEGPRVGLTVPKDGGLTIAGIRLRPAAGATAAAPTAAAFTWPDVVLKKLAWTGLEFRLHDDTLAEPSTLVLDGFSLRGEDLALGRTMTPGRVVANLRVADAIEDLTAEVTTTPSTDGLAADVQVSVSGVTAHALAPWLQRAGITPRLRSGNFKLQASTDVRLQDGAALANLRLASLRFADGEDVLLSLRRLELQEFRSSGSALHLGTLTLDEPFIALGLDADGTPRAMGFRFGPAAAGQAPTPIGGDTAGDETRAHRARPAPTHGPWILRGGVVQWTNDSRPHVGPVSVATEVRVTPDTSGEKGLHSEVQLKVGPGIADFGVQASVHSAEASTIVEAQLHGSALRGEGIGRLLPAGTTCTLQDGQVHAKVRCEIGSGSPGSLRLQVDGFKLVDGGEELLAVDTVDLDVPRLGSDLVHVAAARIGGIRAITARTAEGLHVAGMCLGAAGGPAAEITAAPDQAALSPVSSSPASPSAVSLPSALRVDELDVRLERLVFHERLQQDGEQLVTDLQLRLAEPWATTADVAASPPAKIRLTGAATPLCREIDVQGELAPYAIAPTADFTLRLAGLDMTALTRLAPSLAGRIEGVATDAECSAKLYARLDLRRRDPLTFDFARAFGGELVLDEVELRESTGERLFAVTSVGVDVRAVDPASGDLLLRSVEVDGPVLRVERTATGIEMLGLRFAPPDPASPAPHPAPEGAADAPPASAVLAPEIAVDRFHLQALTLEYVDETTSPPTVIPLRDVDVRVHGASTRALTTQMPVHLAATVLGGNVDLPRRVVHSSVVTGVVSSAAGAIGESDSSTESRPLVEDMAIDCELQLYPAPKGIVRASIQSFELLALQGLAKTAGFEIGDGLLDLDARAELRGADGMLLLATPTFTWLSMTEPAGGPVSSFLSLPLSLDTVLWLIRNEYDEHILPLRVDVPREDMNATAIQSAVVETLAKLIADAVASAHWRVAGMFTGTLGIGPSVDRTPAQWALDFAAGDPLPKGGAIEELVAAAKEDPDMVVILSHELGRGDLERAKALVSPDPSRVAEAIARLRAELESLAPERTGLAVDVATRLAAGDIQKARTLHGALAQLDDRIGAIERTLEDALRMFAGDDKRALERRTRRGAVELATGRLEAVRSLLCQQLGDAGGKRVEWRRPRAVATEGLPEGGRVVAKLRRRAALVEGKPVGLRREW